MVRITFSSLICALLLLISLMTIYNPDAEGAMDIPTTADWSSNDMAITASLAFGDVNGDGLLDLMAGNEGQNVLYLNTAGNLSANPSWTSTDANNTVSLAFGDMDRDGFLDLAVANFNDGAAAYRNQGGALESSASWRARLPGGNVTSVAWGDVDGDGYLDLAVGMDGGPDLLFSNTAGILGSTWTWQSVERYNTQSLAWGDVDGDGDLDLAAGGFGSLLTVHYNDNGTLETTASWRSMNPMNAIDLSWGDINNDGLLDLALGQRQSDFTGQTNAVYLHNGNRLRRNPSWFSDEDGITRAIALGDLDEQEGYDLVSANWNIFSVFTNPMVHENDGTLLQTMNSWECTIENVWSTAIGDVDNDGDLDLAFGSGSFWSTGVNHLLFNPGGPSTPKRDLLPNDPSTVIIEPLPGPYNDTIWIEYTLIDNESDICWIGAEYSTDGMTTWHKATERGWSDGTSDLMATPEGTQHVFEWDVLADEVEAEEVFFRIKVFSNPQQAGIVRYAFRDFIEGPFTVDAIPPKAPSSLFIIDETETTLDLIWLPNQEPDLAGYDLYINDTGEGPSGMFKLLMSGIMDNKCQIANLTDNTTYHFYLVAYDWFPNFSPPSETASGTTLQGNRAPVPTSTALDFQTDEDIPRYAPKTLFQLFDDPDDDKLTFTHTPPQNVTITLFLNGSILIAPHTNWFGNETVVIDASDSLLQASIPLNITVVSVNDPPILNGSGNKVVDERTWLNFTLSAWDPADPHDILTFATDAATIFSGLTSAVFHFDGINGSFSLLTDPSMVGEHSLNLSVSDGMGGIDFEHITVTILSVNDPPVPVITSPLAGEYKSTEGILFDGMASYDPDGDALMYTWELTPGGILSTSASFERLLPPGHYDLTLFLDDGISNISTSPVIFVVLDYTDTDNDGIIDSMDPDDDNDGINDTEDPEPLDPAPQGGDSDASDADDGNWTDPKKDDDGNDDDELLGVSLDDWKWLIILVTVFFIILILLMFYARVYGGARSRRGRRIGEGRHHRKGRYGGSRSEMGEITTYGDSFDDDEIPVFGYDDDYDDHDYDDEPLRTYGGDDYDEYGSEDDYDHYDEPLETYGDDDYGDLPDDYGPGSGLRSY